MPMANAPRPYVSLGDSISIDDYAGGLGWGAASLLFQNRNAQFPEWESRDLSTVLPSTRLVPMARDGATSAAVRFVQIPQLIERGVRPAVVTLTMGGNDLLQSFGDDSAAEAALRSLTENGRAALAKLRPLCESAATPIVIGTIYDPSDGTGDTARLQLLSWPGAAGWIRRFNEVIRTLAAEYDLLVADLHTAFHGHGLLAGDPSQNDALPACSNLYYCGVVEPNAWGASAIRGAWWQTLSDVGFIKES